MCTYLFAPPRINHLHVTDPLWVTKITSACQDIPRALWDPNVHDHAHAYNNTSVTPSLNHMKSAHTIPYYFCKIHSSLGLPVALLPYEIHKIVSLLP